MLLDPLDVRICNPSTMPIFSSYTPWQQVVGIPVCRQKLLISTVLCG